MRYILHTNFKPVDVRLTLKSSGGSGLIKTVVYDPKNNDIILERIDVASEIGKQGKDIVLKLPLTAENTMIEVFSSISGRVNMFKDKSFEVLNPKAVRLKKYDVDYGSGDREFLEFIEKFVQDLPSLDPSNIVIKSPSGTFRIVLFDEIRGYNGDRLNSPAQIGLKTGTIEVGKRRFLKMSQNQRIATLCHEYAHFYKNPLIGRSKKDEYGADMNGMTVYLCRGYGESEYLNAFKKVFIAADTPQNRARYKLIKDFGHKINSGQFFGKPYNI